MRRFCCIFFLLFFFYLASAQNNAINEYSSVVLKNAVTGSFLLHSNGWGIHGQYFSEQNVSRKFIASLDFIGLKHPKETKILNPFANQSRPYVFGKLNSIILVQPGLGGQFIIADKEVPAGIRISFNFSLGPDIALLKPEYLHFTYKSVNGSDINVIEKYNPDNPLHANQLNISGGAGFFKGIDEMQAMPGLNAKISFTYEWSDYESDFKVLETGIMLDAFPEALPIFAYIENQNIFINFYLALGLGKRW